MTNSLISIKCPRCENKFKVYHSRIGTTLERCLGCQRIIHFVVIEILQDSLFGGTKGRIKKLARIINA